MESRYSSCKRIKERLIKNGKKEGKDFWWMVKADEGHGFRLEENKVELYSELINSLVTLLKLKRTYIS